MDLLLNLGDQYVFNHVYPTGTEIFAPTSVVRQFLSLFAILSVGGCVLYLILASLSYFVFWYLFKERFHPPGEPKPKPGQEWLEIKLSLISTPLMGLLTAPIAVLEVQGYSKLYDEVDSWPYFFFSIALFLVFTDTCIYWIHRLEHDIPILYKYIHKPHHAWYVPTPYAAIAFHPVDGWLQSLPYHIFPFLFPFHKVLYLALFVSVQVWTISIHDGVDKNIFGFINGTAHHTLHHSKFLYNYGQFFTFWDRLGGTYWAPGDTKPHKARLEQEAPGHLHCESKKNH